MAPHFIEELLRDAETKEANEKIEVDRLRADQLLTAIATLEMQMTDVNELVEKEIALLEEYRSKELSRVDKKLSWLDIPAGTIHAFNGREDRSTPARRRSNCGRAGIESSLLRWRNSLNVLACVDFSNKSRSHLSQTCRPFLTITRRPRLFPMVVN